MKVCDQEAWGDQIENREDRADMQLNLNPWNFEESVDDSKQAKHEQGAADPKAAHRHHKEEQATETQRFQKEQWDSNHEAHQIQNLKAV